MDNHVKFVDIGAIRVNLRPIIQQVQWHAQEWKNILGQCIASKTKMNMYDLKNQIEVGAIEILRNSYLYLNKTTSTFPSIEHNKTKV